MRILNAELDLHSTALCKVLNWNKCAGDRDDSPPRSGADGSAAALGGGPSQHAQGDRLPQDQDSQHGAGQAKHPPPGGGGIFVDPDQF